MESDFDVQERREQLRYPAVSYTAYVQNLYGFQRFSKPYEAAIIDFHRNGAGFCSDTKISVGNKVRLTIKSAAEQITDIRGVVSYVRHRQTGYWFGVKFIRSRTDKSADLSVLVGLENVLKELLA
ncbi:MAG: PilZ domain-containing protein [Pseudomonadales bacterium]